MQKIIKLNGIFCLSFLTMVAMFILSSCAGEQQIIKVKQPESEFCSTIPEGEISVLCQLCDRVGTTPESISKIVSVTGLMTMEDLYSAQTAYDFLTELIDHAKAVRALTEMGGGRTWEEVARYVTTKHATLPPRMQAALIILSDIVELDIPEINVQVVSLRDWDAIIKDLHKQRDYIAPYIQS